ncbi:MAG TPA: hypothetical protein VII01_13230 [Solirubrobacteraceae bacterium]|jgi:hypothetical protein
MKRTIRLSSMASLLLLLLCVLFGQPGAASATGLEDDGGAAWRLEQPAPPPPPPGVQGSPTPIGLGKIGDIEFWAPNRGVLTTAGNGSTIPPGIWAYNGREWHELATVCGASDGRIAWAGPEDFWTISDGRPGQAPDAFGNPPPLEDNTLCHFSGGRVVASYASLAFRASSYQRMHAAACLSASDCWFAGDPLPPPQVGSFHLHWNGTSMTEEPYKQDSYAIQDLRGFQGQLFESARLTAPTPEEPAALHIINPKRVTPQFEALPGLPLYGGEEFPTALEPFHLTTADGALWAAAGPVGETPEGSSPGQVTVAHYDGATWRQLLGAGSEHSAEPLFGGETVTSAAAEPGTESAWLGLDPQTDAEHPSPTAFAHVARITAEGSVSTEDDQQLPTGGEVGPKGAAEKMTCPTVHDCWMATTQGWLFHLSTGQQLALDTSPAFAGLITERPADEGVPQVQPDAPPPDDSGLLGEPPPPSGELRQTKEAEARVAVALLSHIHTRLVHGDTLELRFHLAAKARVRLIAKRKRKVVGSTPRHTFTAGNRRLLLRLNPRAWPTKLQLETHALAPLPTVSANAGATETVSTSLVVLPYSGTPVPGPLSFGSGLGQLP